MRLFFTVTLFISIHSFGQQMDCSDIASNSSLSFVKYMRENKIDSAKNVLNYWENECGISEPIYRAKILLALKTEQLNDNLLTDNPIDNILKYQHRMEMIRISSLQRYDRYKHYYGFVPLSQEFDNYTRELALELKTTYNPTSTEYLLAELYSDNYDTIFSKIQLKSVLVEEYSKNIEKIKKIPEYHVSTTVGVWIPTSRLKILGIHPELGVQAGLKRKKMNYDLTVAVKFIGFSGKYIGFETGVDVFARKGHEIQAIGGIAYDDFSQGTIVKQEIKYVFASTYNFNFGLAYRYYITHYNYIGLRAKYNIVDYTLNNVVDYTSNPITIQFTIGTVFNSSRTEKLKDLKYKLRK